MRWPVDVEHRVVDRPAAPCERLLQLCLVVDVARERIVDPVGERPHDRLLDRLEPVLEEQCREGRLEQRGEHVAVVRQPLELVVRDVGPPLGEPLSQIQLPRHDRTARARDDVRAHLR